MVELILKPNGPKGKILTLEGVEDCVFIKPYNNIPISAIYDPVLDKIVVKAKTTNDLTEDFEIYVKSSLINQKYIEEDEDIS